MKSIKILLLCFIQFGLFSYNILLGLAFIVSIGFLLEKKQLFVFFLIICFFQNLFISIFSFNIDDEVLFKGLHGLNFFIPLYFFIISYFTGVFSEKERRILTSIFLIISIYLFFGALFYGLLPSIQYFRLFLIPIVFYAFGKYFKDIDIDFKIIFRVWVFVLLATIIGRTFPSIFLNVINADNYFSIKYQKTMNSQDVIDLYQSKFFNNGLFNLVIFRFGSLLNSSISFSFFMVNLSFFTLLITKRKHFYIISILLLIFCSFSKGAILYACFLFIVFITLTYKKIRFDINALIIFILPLWLVIIYFGFQSNNEHMVGFVNGLKNMLLIPEGNGLGFGGNLSPVRLLSYLGKEIPDVGYFTRFYNGSESVFGVLFSSLGILGIVYLIFLKKLISINNSPLIFRQMAIIIMSLGIFQEEAFSAYATGFVFFLIGYYDNVRGVFNNFE